jgi:hypothetical protein
MVRQRLAAFTRFKYQGPMAKKSKRSDRRAGALDHDGDRGGAGDHQGWQFSPWAPILALVPHRIGTKSVAAGTGYSGGDLAVKVELGKPEPIDLGATAEELKPVFEALLQIRGIPQKARNALLHALGSSYRAKERAINQGRDMALLYLTKKEEAHLRANGGKRPRGGWSEAARKAIVAKIGMGNADWLQQRLKRLKRRQAQGR